MSRAARVHSPFRRTAVSRWKAAFALVATLCFSVQALARESIVLLSDKSERGVVAEVLVRAEAELEAVGFVVQRCTLFSSEERCTSDRAIGRLEISHSGSRLVLRAWARGGLPPLTQELDLAETGISAEVAAIRAVELLRATLSLSLREGAIEPEEGGSLEDFTGAERQQRQPEPEPVPETQPAPVPEPDVSDESLQWSVGLGPSLSLPRMGSRPGWGGEFFVDAAFRWIYVGAAFDAALIPSRLEGAEGSTDITSFEAAFRLGGAAPCPDDWSCRAGAFAGLVQYGFRANESPSFTGSDERHLSFVAGADVTLAWFFERWMGVFARARAGMLSDAPRLELAEPVTLGRPTGGFSLGVTFR